jgi:hypothetical protein
MALQSHFSGDFGSQYIGLAEHAPGYFPSTKLLEVPNSTILINE